MGIQQVDLPLFNVIVSLAMLLIGWLLARIFIEIDKLREVDTKLSDLVTKLAIALPTDYLDKKSFQQHVEEERAMWHDIQERIDGRFDRIEAMVSAAGAR
jgi:hypothetical protein